MSEQKLPTVQSGAQDNGPDAGNGETAPPVEQVPAWRLFMTLAFAGALAGLVIVLVYQWAQPRIQAHQLMVLREAIQEVLKSPAHYETLYVRDGALTPEPPPGQDSLTAERVFLGYDEEGNPIGFAVTGEKPGFQDIIRLIFGYDPATDRVLGMTVLESKETPGLGDKIEKDSSFVNEFEGVQIPLVGVKDGGDGPNEVDTITGATISSEVIIEIINQRIETLEPMLEDYMSREVATATSGGTQAWTARGPGALPSASARLREPRHRGGGGG